MTCASKILEEYPSNELKNGTFSKYVKGRNHESKQARWDEQDLELSGKAIRHAGIRYGRQVIGLLVAMQM